jgi:hypothetical protein
LLSCERLGTNLELVLESKCFRQAFFGEIRGLRPEFVVLRACYFLQRRGVEWKATILKL